MAVRVSAREIEKVNAGKYDEEPTEEGEGIHYVCRIEAFEKNE